MTLECICVNVCVPAVCACLMKLFDRVSRRTWNVKAREWMFGTDCHGIRGCNSDHNVRIFPPPHAFCKNIYIIK